MLAEFYHQGDAEKKAGLAVSMFFDREKPSVGKMQTGFINFIVKPIFTAWCDYVPVLRDVCMPHLEANHALWTAAEPYLPAEQIYVDASKSDWDWDRGRWADASPQMPP